MAYKRRESLENRMRNLYGHRKKRGLESMYPGKPELVASIIARKTATGGALPDPEAPNDPEEPLSQ